MNGGNYPNLLITVAPPAGYAVTHVRRDGDKLTASIVCAGDLADCLRFIAENMRTDTLQGG